MKHIKGIYGNWIEITDNTKSKMAKKGMYWYSNPLKVTFVVLLNKNALDIQYLRHFQIYNFNIPNQRLK